jgi:DNA-binding response OmpR family regulator
MKFILPDLSSYKALYLEDEALIAMDGEEILKMMGIGYVYVAHTVEDAVKAVSRKKFDLALLDINLGGGQSSLKLAEELIKGGTVVVFASGYHPSEGIVASLNVPLVVKPFDDQAIRAAFAQAFANRNELI